MGKRSPGGYTLAVRRKMCQHELGHRPVNNWGRGDLPAPWAAGDTVFIPKDAKAWDRMRGKSYGGPVGPGLFVIDTVFSVDEGDGWYFRVDNLDDRWSGSDRLHYFGPRDRCPVEILATPRDANGVVDWTEGFELVETLDAKGLALREQMIADGWTFAAPEVCPCCGRGLTSQDNSLHPDGR